MKPAFFLYCLIARFHHHEWLQQKSFFSVTGVELQSRSIHNVQKVEGAIVCGVTWQFLFMYCCCGAVVGGRVVMCPVVPRGAVVGGDLVVNKYYAPKLSHWFCRIQRHWCQAWVAPVVTSNHRVLFASAPEIRNMLR